MNRATELKYPLKRVLSESLGSSWASNFASFDPIPFAAASLGQVHSAVLLGSVSPTGVDEKVAVKIQFPDIARSIDSDLGYLKVLLTAGKLLPRGLFLDKTIKVCSELVFTLHNAHNLYFEKVMKGELADECDYTHEASAAQFFSSPSGLGNDPRFRVPWVWEGSTKQVLIMQFMDGVSVGGNVVDVLTQNTRDEVRISLRCTSFLVPHLSTPDCHENTGFMYEGAFRVPYDADRS